MNFIPASLPFFSDVWIIVTGHVLNETYMAEELELLEDQSSMQKWMRSILSIFAEKAAMNVRKQIDKQGLVKTGAMRAGIDTIVTDKQVIVFSKKKYAMYLDRGVKPHSMKYLLDRTIPFISTGGKMAFAGKGSSSYGAKGVFFRTVTAKSLASGAWFHPGIKPHNFFRLGMQEALDEVQKEYPQINIELSFT